MSDATGTGTSLAGGVQAYSGYSWACLLEQTLLAGPSVADHAAVISKSGDSNLSYNLLLVNCLTCSKISDYGQTKLKNGSSRE